MIRAAIPARLAALAAAVLAATAAPPLAAAAAAVCDPGLVGSESSPMAYQARGNRCEGIYKLEVNSELLRLVAITETFEPLDGEKPRDVSIEWSPPSELAAQELRIRAISLDHRSYYRMDSAPPAAAKLFAWPAEIPGRLGLDQESLGVRGFLAHPRPPEKDFAEIYLPLRLWQEERPPRRRSCEIAFVPEVKLKEAFVSVVPVDLDGRPRGAPLLDKQPLEYGYYPAKAPVFFEVSEFAGDGYYRIDLMALDSIGGSMSHRFLLYHEDPKP